MRDTVSLVRKRVGDPEMAFRDEMLDSVVTMAAIEVSLFKYIFCW